MLGIPPRWLSVDEWKRGCGTCTHWTITQPRERKRRNNISNKDRTGYRKMDTEKWDTGKWVDLEIIQTNEIILTQKVRKTSIRFSLICGL